jgi:hypothetical protein
VGVDDLAAGLAVEVDVFVEIGAVTGLTALEVDLLDEAVGGEVIKAVINRCQGDVGGAAFHPVEDVVGRRVVRGSGQDIENLTAVGCQAHIGPENGEAAVQTRGFGGSAWS